MGTYPVKKPAIMRDHHGTAGEVLKSFFHRTKRVYVDIVGRLIQQQYVRLCLERECQVQTVTFTTGQHTAQFFLIGTGEVKTGQISAGVNLFTPDTDKFCSAGDHLIDCFLRIDRFMGLIHIGCYHGLPYFESSLIRFFHSLDHTEKGGFSCTVGANHPHDTIGRQHEVEVIEQQLVTEGFGYSPGINHLIPQSGSVGDKDLQLLFTLFLILVQQLLIGVKTCFSFGLAGLGSQVDPIQLTLQRLAALADLLLFLCHPLCLLLQP